MNADSIRGVYGDPIEGVLVKRLAVIPDERGAVMHMLRNDDPWFLGFGEVYFSKAHPGMIKAWHLHRRVTLNYAVVAGMAKIVLYDDRPESSTRHRLMEVFAGDTHYLLVQIPPGIWNGYTPVGTAAALIANCATEPHAFDEIDRLDPFSGSIPYDWSKKHG